MNKFIVSYDIISKQIDEDQQYDLMTSTLEEIGDVAHVQKSVWLVATEHDCDELFELIKEKTKKIQKRLIVAGIINLKSAKALYANETENWINRNFPLRHKALSHHRSTVRRSRNRK